MPPKNNTPAQGQPVSDDSALQLVLQRMDQIHADLGDIKQVQTDMVTRLAVGQQTIDAVRGVPVEIAVLKSELKTLREKQDTLEARIADLEADRKTLMWKAISVCGGLATLVGVLSAYLTKAPTHAP